MMQSVALAVGSVVGLCVGLAVILVLYTLWRRRGKQPEIVLRNKSYTVVHHPQSAYDSDSLSSEKVAILQQTHSLDTVPFEVPGSVTTRGWGADTPRTSVTTRGWGADTPRTSLSDVGSSLDKADDEHPRVVRVLRAREASGLGSVDPALYTLVDDTDDYDLPERHIGRIWFAVAYEREMEKLLVTLIRAKNLPSRSYGATNACDPLVRMYLLPDERRYMQSKSKKKTCNPQYNENFILQVPQKTFSARVLKLTVYDVDRYKRHRVIGHATYCLDEHREDLGEKAIIWRDLERDIPETSLDRGDVKVSLCYNDHYERLTVGVYEGTNFKRADDSCSPDFYLRVSLLVQSRVTKTKRTSTARQTSAPAFNESFNLKLPQQHIDSASVSVNAMQVISGGRDKCSGRVVLGSFMFSRGKELDHWNEMVANPRTQVSRWHAFT